MGGACLKMRTDNASEGRGTRKTRGKNNNRKGQKKMVGQHNSGYQPHDSDNTRARQLREMKGNC